jgi:hypothetical protein
MLKTSHDGNAGCIGQVAIVVEDVHIGADTPAAHTLKNAQGFSVQGVRATDDAVENVGHGGLEIIGPVR